MFRNSYDTGACAAAQSCDNPSNVTTWSPQGRLHQIEYAMEAVKQGSACVGCRSDTHVVIAALKRADNDLSSFQPKVFKVDSHLGIAMAGLTADGRVLCRYMRSECVNHRFVYESPLATTRLVTQIADKSQANTQRSWKRPYGVGLLVAGHDSTGPHLFQTCPSGNFYEFKAMAIGARSQASKTYLEKTFTTFPGASLEELCRHALLALREAAADGELTAKNASLAFVGKDTPFTLVEDLQPYLQALAAEGAQPQAEAMAAEAQPPPPQEEDAAAMES